MELEILPDLRIFSFVRVRVCVCVRFLFYIENVHVAGVFTFCRDYTRRE